MADFSSGLIDQILFIRISQAFPAFGIIPKTRGKPPRVFRYAARTQFFFKLGLHNAFHLYWSLPIILRHLDCVNAITAITPPPAGAPPSGSGFPRR
jgi:hypothetical protein